MRHGGLNEFGHLQHESCGMVCLPHGQILFEDGLKAFSTGR